MGKQSRRRSDQDSTLVRNQPALQTSSGAIWLVVGALFVAVSLIPFILIIVDGGPAVITASVASGIMLVLYLSMLIIRFATGPGRRRLRGLAACLLAIAVVGLGGMLLVVALQR